MSTLYYGNKTMIPQAAIATGDAVVYGEMANLALGDLIVTSGHKQLLIGDDNYEATVPRKRIVSVTGDYYFRKIDDVVIADASAGNINIYLPSGATGLCATVVKSDGSANSVYVSVSGSGQFVDGTYSVAITTSGGAMQFINGGNPVYSVANNYPITIRLRRPSQGVTGILSTQEVVFEGEPLFAIDTHQLFIGGSGEYDRFRIPCLYAKSISGDYSPTYEDVLLCDAQTGNMLITLPSASGTGIPGITFNIKKIDTGEYLVYLTGSQNIDGETSYQVSGRNAKVRVFSDGEQWWTI